jgi:KaiC/GvpD/RAD55 family RecA-like ATPase
MVKSELIQKSPVRILEKSIEGGLKKGNIGIIASRKGIGKTSVLVQLALDKLFQERKVIHVSFVTHTSYVISWYENIFNEIARKKNLDGVLEVHDEISRNRVLMNFNQETVTKEQLLKSIKAMIVDGGFGAESLIIDGYDFAKADKSMIQAVKAFAVEMGLEVWYSCTVMGAEPLFDHNDIPLVLKDLLDSIAVVIVLEPKSDYIHLTVSKDHDRLKPEDLSLKLDAKTLLIAER